PSVRDEAVALLRSIDNEDFNQARLQATRSFDAVEAAYRRRDYAYAGAVLARIETKYLDPARQARLRELAQVPEMSAGPVRLASGPGTPSSGLIQASYTRPAGPGH